MIITFQPPPPPLRLNAILTLTPEEQDEIVKTWKGTSTITNPSAYSLLMMSISNAILKIRA